ncbi:MULTISPECIES: Uma2 family endonuclease [unclassified Micromonospora]|uniref:Uma2 family endonuclease n=1 Tax=unclassified Micromonospora TaxID=2617518 RepID=UPI002FF23A0F
MLLTRGSAPVPDLDGGWTVRRAERHLRIGELAGARHECLDGRLVVTPFPPATESIAMASLASALVPAAEAAGRHVLGRVNLTFSPSCWIQPDVTVLHTLPASDEEERWVPAELCVLAVQFVRPGGPGRDGAETWRRCADGGVPYVMRVETGGRSRPVAVELFGLDGDGHYVRTARAVDGQRLRARAPFPIDVDPARLLPRTRQTRSTSGPVGHVGSQRGTNR